MFGQLPDLLRRHPEEGDGVLLFAVRLDHLRRPPIGTVACGMLQRTRLASSNLAADLNLC
jgi:hypothetical protein